MRTLLVDNYDSFTYNLFQLLAVVNGAEPTVVRNDASLADIDFAEIDNIVVSPGPGHPERPRDFGISAGLIAHTELPLLGVCLGHQGIVTGAGGSVGPAPTPRHGYLELIRHDGSALFADIPTEFTVVRYHSLAAVEPLPADLVATAWSPDGVVMALEHRRRPQWGVQFHPESVASEHGDRLLRNFADLTRTRRREHIAVAAPPPPKVVPRKHYRVLVHTLDRAVDAEAAFVRLYSDAPHAFWLDSEHVEPGLDRFSFLGDAAGPLSERVTYRVGTEHVVVTDAAGNVTQFRGTIFDYLSGELADREFALPALPFDFACGYVGYFGYECKADIGAPTRHRSRTADAQWLFVDRMIAVDHHEDKTYILALHDDTPETRTAAEHWLVATATALADAPRWHNPAPLQRSVDADAAEPLLTRDRTRYLADVEACLASLRAGESYELCLTNSARVAATQSALDFYRLLRRCNPAPYAAFLRFDDVEIACSSPERFLEISRDGTVESKPIKGTARRGESADEDARLREQLLADPKTRAENLIIVDLLRNDLGRVCTVGSVHVPNLMAVESYRTVHQLVSTVRGTLRPEVDAIGCVRACFPGGSMTGAPKLRTLEILDEIEGQARGVYSGAIGFLGPGRTANLNVVIRTAVRTDGEWQIGAGGAVVLDSDPRAEYEEMLLKLLAPLRAHLFGKHSASADRRTRDSQHGSAAK